MSIRQMGFLIGGVVTAILSGGCTFLVDIATIGSSQPVLDSSEPETYTYKATPLAVQDSGLGPIDAYVSNQDFTKVVLSSMGDFYITKVDGSGAKKIGPPSEFKPSGVHNGKITLIEHLPISNRYIASGNLVANGGNDDNSIYIFNEDGSDFRRLTNKKVRPCNPQASVRLSFADEVRDRVIYCAKDDSDNLTKIYSVKLDGTGMTQLSLNPEVGGGGYIGKYLYSRTEGFVVYTATLGAANKYEVFSSKADGTTQLKLSGTLCGTCGGLNYVYDMKLLNNETEVGFVGSKDSAGKNELYLTKVDGSGAVFKVNSSLAGNLAYQPTIIDANPDAVFYLASQDLDYRTQLYRYLKSTGARVRISPSGLNTNSHVISPNGAYVAHISYDNGPSMYYLYVSNADGTNRVTVKTSTAQDGGFQNLRFSADSSKLFFNFLGTASLPQLFSMNRNGSNLQQLTNNGGTSPSMVDSQDGLSVFFINLPWSSSVITPGVSHFYSAAIDGSATTDLASSLPLTAKVSDFLYDMNASHIILRVTEGSHSVDNGLSVVPNKVYALETATQTLQDITPRLPLWKPSFSPENLIPNSNRVLKFGAYQTPNAKELFVEGVDGSNRIKLNSPHADSYSNIKSYLWKPGMERVIFYGNLDSMAENNIWSVKLDGTDQVYLPGGRMATLYRRVRHAYRYHPAVDRVLFSGSVDVDNYRELYSVNLDGSDRIALSSGMPLTGAVRDFSFNADGTRVAFTADADTTSVLELYLVPTDGSMAYVKLSPPLSPTGSLLGYSNGTDFTDSYLVRFSEDDRFVFYIADAIVDGQFDLFKVKTDGTNNTKLNGSLDPGLVVGAIRPLSGTGKILVAGVTSPVLSYFSQQYLYLVNEDGSEWTSLYAAGLTSINLFDPNTKILTQNRSGIVFANLAGDYYYYDFGLKLLTKLYSSDSSQNFLGFHLFSDFTKFLFYSFETNINSEVSLLALNSDGEKASVGPSSAGEYIASSWTVNPTQDELFYYTLDANNKFVRLYQLKMDGSKTRKINIEGLAGKNMDWIQYDANLGVLNISANLRDESIHELFSIPIQPIGP